MKNLLRMSVIACLACIGLSSCSTNSKDVQVKDVKIIEDDSELKEWFIVVPGTYHFETTSVGTSEGSKVQIGVDIEFKKTKESTDYDLVFGDIYLIPKDISDNSIKDDIGDDIKIDVYNVNNLMNLKNGNRDKLPVGYYIPNDEIKNTLLKTIDHFDVYCKVTKKEGYDSEIEPVDLSSNNWDSLLDNYDKMVEEYGKLVKGMKSGNVDMSSLTNIATKAAEIQEKLEDNKSELTSKQVQRLTKIASKMASVAANAATVNPQNIQSINGVDLKDLGL
jgi:hypothetical protein